jgi:hypothetical protein
MRKSYINRRTTVHFTYQYLILLARKALAPNAARHLHAEDRGQYKSISNIKFRAVMTGGCMAVKWHWPLIKEMLEPQQ